MRLDKLLEELPVWITQNGETINQRQAGHCGWHRDIK